MLTAATVLLHFRAHTADDDLVRVRDLYFDDDSWMVRYFVVDTHRWLPGREVLVSPSSVVDVARSRRQLDTSLTMEQIRTSPDLDTVRPPNRRYETTLPHYFGLPGDWTGGDLWAAEIAQLLVASQAVAGCAAERDHEHDPRLRSVRGLLDYTVKALDRDVGRVDDVLVDSPPWEVRYVVVDTSSWVPGRRVLVPTTRVALISCHEVAVHVRVTGAVIRNAPSYDPSRPVSTRDDAYLLEYYSRDARS
jgi:hypothetical protein